MDRRQLLLGMTAVGLAGQFNLGELLDAQTIEGNGQTSKAQQSELTARGRAGLHGPVKMCVEETVSDYGKSARTTEYGLDGQLLTSRYETNGKLSYASSSSDWQQTEVHDSQGRLAKLIYGKRGEPVSETLYTYDDAGRLLTFTNSGMSRIEFHYQGDGSKTSIQTFDPKFIERRQGSVSASPEWISAQAGSGVPMGGSVTMIYDTDDHPTEMQIRGADGELVTRIVRTYDTEGRITEERLLEKNMSPSHLDWMPPEERAQMTPAQARAYSKGFYALIKNPIGTTYAYDAQGRLTKTRERNVMFEETTTTLYNEQGDKSREHKTTKANSILPLGPSYSYSFDADGKPIISKTAPEGTERPERDYMPQDLDIRYAYQYDGYGNWTERIGSQADGSSTTTRRELTYY
jgi:YD repeat-containing protein